MLYRLIILALSSSVLAAYQEPLGTPKAFSWDPTFDDQVAWCLEHFNVPGLAVSFVHGEEWSAKGYGHPDLSDPSREMSEHTLFTGASTTKAFTAAAIALLVEDNERYPDIQWDTPVHQILPIDFALQDPWTTTQLTVEDLLSHRSGLPAHDLVWFANITLQQAVRKIRYLPFTAPIRTKFQYSNLMYMTAAHLVETVTGQPFKDFLRERIWEPLNMTETYLSMADAQNAGKDIARGYHTTSAGELVDTQLAFQDNGRGAGNIISSVTDYSKWIRVMIYRHPPIPPAGYAAILSGHTIMTPEPISPDVSSTLYGFGWVLNVYQGELIVSHTGGIQGYGSFVVFLPKRQFGLVILGNHMIAASAAAIVLVYQAIDDFLEVPVKERFDWVEQAEKFVNSTHAPPDTILKLYPEIPNPKLPLTLPIHAYEGIYVHDAYPTLNISTNCQPDISSLKDSQTQLCAQLLEPAIKDIVLILEFQHVTGDFWVLKYSWYGQVRIMRAKFSISPEGTVSEVGIEIEPLMVPKGQKIWWQKTS